VADSEGQSLLVRGLVLLACVAVLAVAFAVVANADGALRWIAAVAATIAALATLTAAVRLFASLSLRLEPRGDRRR
jgi:hypothetical protein